MNGCRRSAAPPMTPEAHQHLSRADPIMAGLIDRNGLCQIKPKPSRTPFESLVRAVAHQQLHGKAAENILRRFQEAFPGKRFPTPQAILDAPVSVLRAAGFSTAKSLAIRDISAKALERIVPSSRTISILTDDEIIERLTTCRGIGVWSVQMLLIFKLGRPDVLPADDFGVRNGFRLAYGGSDLPKPKDLLEFGKRWSPHRTTASWYLWRAADATPAKAPPKLVSRKKK